LSLFQRRLDVDAEESEEVIEQRDEEVDDVGDEIIECFEDAHFSQVSAVVRREALPALVVAGYFSALVSTLYLTAKTQLRYTALTWAETISGREYTPGW
jgi:hypothetical protein